MPKMGVRRWGGAGTHVCVRGRPPGMEARPRAQPGVTVRYLAGASARTPSAEACLGPESGQSRVPVSQMDPCISMPAPFPPPHILKKKINKNPLRPGLAAPPQTEKLLGCRQAAAESRGTGSLCSQADFSDSKDGACAATLPQLRR